LTQSDACGRPRDAAHGEERVESDEQIQVDAPEIEMLHAIYEFYRLY
jgi:hypothetical protein